MTPEEQLHAMSDPSRWELEPYHPTFARARTLAAPRRRSWVVGLTTVATVIVAVAVVLGVVMWRGSTPAPIATLAPSPSVTPSPSATLTPTADVSAPAQLFDGDCSAVMSVAEFIDAGAGTDPRINQTPASESLFTDDLYAIFERGGVQCQWVSTGLVVSLTAVPAAGLPAASDQPCEGTVRSCRFDVTASGVRFSVTVAAESLSDSKRLAPAIRDLFVAKAPNGALASSERPAGSWPAASCATLVADLRSVLPDAVPHLLSHMQGKAPIIQDLVRATYVDSNLGCEALSPSHPGGGAFIGAYGGGAWKRDYLTALSGTKKITVAGFEDAYTYTSQPSAPGAEQVWLFRGPNAIRISYPTKSFSSYMAALATLADHLDATTAG